MPVRRTSPWPVHLRTGLALPVLLGPLLFASPAGAAPVSGVPTADAIAWSHPTGLTTDSEVFVLRPADGSGQRRLTANDRNDSFPAWSPDGTMVAFESSSATDVDVWVTDGRTERNVTDDPGHADRYPAWSPDGAWLVVSRQSPFDGTGPLYIVATDGSGAQRITSAGEVDEQPAWSPDGSVIVFASQRGGQRDLWSVRPDGTGLTRITDTPDVQESNPDWSPDGTRLAYDACRAASYPCPGSQPNYEVLTARPDGTGVRVLTRVPGIDANPSWSPDGSRLVFRSDRTGFTQLWTMTADGGDLVQLTTANFTGGVDPDWRPAVDPAG